MISKKLTYGLILLVAIGLAIGTYSIRTNHSKNKNQSTKKVEASSSLAVLTSDSDWNAGTTGNILVSSGSIQINDKGASNIDLSGKTITADYDDLNKGRLVDGLTDQFWGSNASSPTDYYWQIDLGNSMSIKQVGVYASASDWLYKVQYSLNGTDFSDYSSYYNPAGGGWATYTTSVSTRYIKILCSRDTTGPMAPPGVFLGEITIQYDSTATHTSASSQIGATGDAERYVSEYQSFTPTESEPANSDITYRFRLTTSDGGSTGTWTDYIDYTGTAIDLTAQSALAITQTEIDAEETYLQVQSRLTSTDGVSTPTLSDYTASYHTNKAPSAPVPQ